MRNDGFTNESRDRETCGHENSSKLHRKILPTKNQLKRKSNKGDKFYLGEKR